MVRKTCRLLSFLLLFALAGVMAAETLDELPGHFFRARAAGDLDALLAMSAREPSYVTAMRNQLRSRCFELRAISTPKITVNSDHATIEVDAVADVSSTMPGSRATLETEHAVLDAQRVQESWKLTRWRRAEDLLADEVASAPDEASRWKLIDAHPELQTTAFVRALHEAALKFVNTRKYDAATALGDAGMQLATMLGDLGGQSRMIGLRGVMLLRRVNPDVEGGLALERKGVALAEDSGDPDVISQALLRLGNALLFNQPDEARYRYEQVIALRPYLEDPWRAGLAACILGDYYRERGDYRTALRYAEIGVSAAESSSQPLAPYTGELLLGNTYSSEGDYDLAIVHLQRALAVANRVHFNDGAVSTLIHLARCYAGLHRSAEFLRTIDQALAQAAEFHLTDALYSDLYLQRGSFYLDRGDLAHADPDLAASLASARAGRQNNQVGPALAELAELRLAQRRYPEAIDLAGQAIAAFNEMRSYDRFEPLVTAARAYRALGQRDAAYAKLREALSVTEAQRGVVAGGERQQELFFTERVPAYQSMIDLLIEDHRNEEALRTAESSKGRTLLDILAGGRLRLESAVSADDRKREEELRAAGARAELEAFQARLYAKYPGLQAQRDSPPPVTSDEMSALLHDEHAAFIEYVVEPKRVRIFVVRRRHGKTRIDVRTAPIAFEKLAAGVKRYVSEIGQRYQDYRMPARALYDTLLAPVEPLLASVRVAGIIPDGPLWKLPFESLIGADGRAVVDRMATFYTPSITVYHQMTLRAPSPARSFLGFSEIPNAGEREVRTIASLFPAGNARVYSGPAAVASKVRSDAPRFGVVHFATHGELDDTNPMYSRLLLAGGQLETWELMQLDLHAQLTVLSACDTGRGVVHDGEGLIGMSWALFAAGCPSTIVSKWRVESESTASLMIDFYRQWLSMDQKHVPFAKALALRAARLRMRRDEKRSNPYYWSAFVLVGRGD